ncbi:ribokinase [Abditibacterium utsteinense]|uniref:Ribokinase n=1 Tax=Abditibacterium utsteinense TaxID=1960156 RepID=A0A2S8SWE6_9BACT|nr:PfkB family carbohydrate kinase [Abditibacterium utsteinense]PQV65107.1 ribokinase [Abditibacterium utsteinense]
MNELLIVGSVALDSVETPAGRVENALGGAATYGSVAASLFGPVQLVGVVGADFPREHLDFLRSRGIDLAGLQIVEDGHTFRWKGDYNDDLNQAVTHETQLGVFEHFDPQLPENYRDAEFVFLANINPSLQLATLEQVKNPKLVVCDTMNLWINIARDQVLAIFRRVDIAVLNDGEAKMLTECQSTIEAGRELLKLGPRAVIIKKGEHGALMFSQEGIFSAPSYPIERVVDPTGAGDSFAGSFAGFLAARGDLSYENLKRAVIYGGAVASVTVQDFSLQSLRALQKDEVEKRYQTVQQMAAF